MYTFEPPILYSEEMSCGDLFLRSAPKKFSLIVCARGHGAVRFLFWWLFLHRRLRSRQRGSTSEDVSGWPPIGWSLPKGWLPVFIRTTQRSSDLLASLSASAPNVPRQLMSALCYLSNDASPHPFHLSVPVKLPVSNLDCEAILHPYFSMSSRKYFKYLSDFRALTAIVCGKLFLPLVDNSVENPRNIFEIRS